MILNMKAFISNLFRVWLQRIGIAVLSGVQIIKETKFGSDESKLVELLIMPSFGWINRNSWYFFGFSILCIIASYVARKFATDPDTQKIVHELLNEARGHLFKTEVLLEDPQDHHHRLTLFQHRKFFLSRKTLTFRKYNGHGSRLKPNSGWLVPVMRSGHITQKVKSIFAATDEGFCEGITGLTWNCSKGPNGGIIHRPSLSPVSFNSDNAAIAKYASETLISADYVRSRIAIEGRIMPVCLCGVPILVNNRPWGVLVIDSTQVNSIYEPDGAHFKYYGQLQSILGKILERW